jgi:hypothetical protein
VAFVDVLGIDPEVDTELTGKVGRILSVALGLSHGLGECVLALVDERSATADRDVMQVVAFVVDDQSDPSGRARFLISRYPNAVANR